MEALSMYFTEEFRVYYEDTDSGGVMYYANFLKFAERGRTEALRHLGISQQDLADKSGLFFIVKSCSINYIKSAKLDDTIVVKTLFKKVQQTSALVVQNLHCNGALLAELEVVVVCVKKKSDTNFVPARIPLEIAAKLRQNNKAKDPIAIHHSAAPPIQTSTSGSFSRFKK